MPQFLKSDEAKMLFYVMPVMPGKTLSTAQKLVLIFHIFKIGNTKWLFQIQIFNIGCKYVLQIKWSEQNTAKISYKPRLLN
jgi:hypothetical protein